MSVEFVVGLPRISAESNSVCIVIDCLKKVLFLHIKNMDSMEKLTSLFVAEIVSHMGSKTIMLDKDESFTSQFWQGLQSMIGTKLKFNSAYHPQIDGKTK